MKEKEREGRSINVAPESPCRLSHRGGNYSILQGWRVACGGACARNTLAYLPLFSPCQDRQFHLGETRREVGDLSCHRRGRRRPRRRRPPLVFPSVCRSGDQVRHWVADKYAERVDEGCLKMQLRSGPSRTAKQPRPCRRSRSDGTSLSLSSQRIGPRGPETAEGCSQKWSGCPTNTRRSTAT